MTCKDPIYIHFFENRAFVLDFFAGHRFHLLGEFFDTLASVSFNETNDYILATFAAPQRFTQHAESLSDARGIA